LASDRWRSEAGDGPPDMIDGPSRNRSYRTGVFGGPFRHLRERSGVAVVAYPR